ncbi:hypothetical protein ACVNHC_11420 [Pannonibacter sp. Q-1]|uniref:Uncharacterized protein n=1 Tax=Pannonibacter phragmitetus TaxID=121719 RepID=A0A0L0IZS7_9HYPH|nr:MULTISPECIES: hypothetical protein [Pannonibacter]ALV27595.1 hypothetical protein APZ00_11395 [Pannonibacter phragmitetus]KND18956.1 hypothetical protein ADZ37_11315 [Pannonibacter phragmitetus]MBA4204221.1 hypothetical protein [Polymorphum sp.]
MFSEDKTQQPDGPAGSPHEGHEEREAFQEEAREIVDAAEAEPVPERLQDLALALGEALESAHDGAALLPRSLRDTH